MKVWIISELFYPEEISTGYVMTRIAEKISEDVEEVNIICGPSNYESSVFEATRKITEKIVIHRISVPNLNKNNLVLRILKMSFLTTKIVFKAVRSIRKNDKVILVTNPPSLLLFISILKKLIGFEYVVIVHDVFPENVIPAGILNSRSLIYKLLLRVFSLAYNVSDKLIAVGNDMSDLLSNKISNKEKIKVIQNWADSDEIFPIKNFNKNEYYNLELSDKIVLQFAGNIGRVQGLDSFIGLFKEISNPNLALIIIGEGALKESLMNVQKCQTIENIYFLEAKPRNEQLKFLNACDIGLITLCNGMYGLGVPSKTYNILAAGKPILFVGDRNAEISLYVNNHNVGWAFSWDRKDEILAFLNGLNIDKIDEIIKRGRNARELVEECFTEEIILNKYKKALK